jgi:uncharacterized membrane protein SpoIIM required for sporulation
LSIIVDTLKIIVGRRGRLMALLFVAELASILVVSSLPFFPGELSLYQEQYRNVGTILNAPAIGQVAAIFENNFRVALLETIPGLGIALFSFSLYETARIVQVISVEKSMPLAEGLANLFFLPSTWLELPAYSIAVTEGAYFLYAIYFGLRHGWARFRRELRFLVVNVLLVAGVLIAAAVIEVAEIQLASNFGDIGPFLALLTWVPFLVLVAGAVAFWRKANRDAPILEAEEEARDAGLGSNVTGV